MQFKNYALNVYDNGQMTSFPLKFIDRFYHELLIK